VPRQTLGPPLRRSPPRSTAEGLLGRCHGLMPEGRLRRVGCEAPSSTVSERTSGA
jgi:hypothetical protein